MDGDRLPIASTLLAAAFLILTRVSLPFSSALAATEQPLVAHMLKDMGPMSVPEKRVAAVFAMVVAAWILGPLIGPLIGIAMSDTGIAIAGVIALCAIPAGGETRTSLLNLETARKAPYDILILFGGGLSLAQAMESSGLALWIGHGLSFLHGMPIVVLLAGVALLVIFISEFMSNTATAAAFLPIAGSLAIGRRRLAFADRVVGRARSLRGLHASRRHASQRTRVRHRQDPLAADAACRLLFEPLSAAIITVGLTLAVPFL
jgi:sodium-dependent dicarboxylate transporter 2/3/5